MSCDNISYSNPVSPFIRGCPLITTVGQLGASSTGAIPAGAISWSLTIIGANGTVNAIAMGTGTTLAISGAPLDSDIALVTGTTTTINYAYIK